MMRSGASAVLTVVVMNLPLCGLMSVMLGVIRGAVMMEVPVKFCINFPVLLRCASALCQTVYPMMSCLSGSLMCVSVRTRMSIRFCFMISMMLRIFPASMMPVVFQVPILNLELLCICMSCVFLLVLGCAGSCCVGGSCDGRWKNSVMDLCVGF